MRENIVLIDVGSGTQDILIYQEGKNIENCPKLVMPSQTQIVAEQIKNATAEESAIYLYGEVMGGGACSAALKKHLTAGCKAYASPSVAQTFNNHLDEVEKMGVILTNKPPLGVKKIWMGDVNDQAFTQTLEAFGVGKADQYVIAVQDHGYSETESNRLVRFNIWEKFLCSGGKLTSLIYRNEVPEVLIRMQAIRRLLPNAIVADTGTAALLGIMTDPAIGEMLKKGIIAVNIGNSHTLAAAIKGERVYGLVEQHTGNLDVDSLAKLVQELQTKKISNTAVFEAGGHGAVLDQEMETGFDQVVVTGPRRALAKPLGWYEAAPYGDMMLTGCFGLLRGIGKL